MPGIPLSIVVFAHNEAENVSPVLDELKRWLHAHQPDAEIVFVDDGSSDATGTAAMAALHGIRAKLRRHPMRRGIGAALKTGVEAASGDWVTFLPADGQIPPAAIDILWDTAHDRNADVVLSVYDHRDDGLHRKLLSWGVRTLISAVHGVKLRSDGPYLFRRALFLPKELPPDSFFLNFEFPIRVLRSGLRVATVTIPCRRRRSGRSKSSGLRTVGVIAYDVLEMRQRDLQNRWLRWRGR